MSDVDGCPCGSFGKCCDSPDTGSTDHECSDEDVCEDCYAVECYSCGAVCYCDL